MENETPNYLQGLSEFQADKFYNHLRAVNNQLTNDIEQLETNNQKITIEVVRLIQKQIGENFLQMNDIVNDFIMYKSANIVSGKA